MPEKLVVQLSSIVERLNLAELFPKAQPLEVELGCGDASFLVEYARRHPERNFIGVERLLGRISKLDRKGRRAGLANLRGVRIESAYFLQWLLPPRSGVGAACLFSRSVAEAEAPPAPAGGRKLSGARPRGARARRRGLFADGRRGLFPADDGGVWRERGFSGD